MAPDVALQLVLAAQKATADSEMEMFKSIIASGQAALKSATLINGGVATYVVTGTIDPSTPAGTGTLINKATATPPESSPRHARRAKKASNPA